MRSSPSNIPARLRNLQGGPTFNEYMNDPTLQFQGASGAVLHLVILAGIALSLTVYGLWQLVRRRVRVALISLAAAVGAVGPAMLIDGVVHHARRRVGITDALHLGRLAALLATAIVVVVVLLLPDAPQVVWMTVLAFQVAAAVGVFYAAVYTYLGTARLATLMALRSIAIITLMLVLFKPALSFTPWQGQIRPILPIVVDRSGSMSTTDRPHDPSRYRLALERLLTQRDRIGKRFEPYWHHFSASLQTVESLDQLHELRAETDPTVGTDIANAISNAVGDLAPGELAGVLLLSDGIHNAPTQADEAAADAGVPVYVVAMGSDDVTAVARRNLSIVSIEAPVTVVRENVTTLTVRIRMDGLAGKTAELRLLEADSDQPVDVFSLRTQQNSRTIDAKLKWTPKASGAQPGAEARGRAERRTLRIEIPPQDGEITDKDNSAELHVLVTEPRIRLLYVEGSIRPEYKFLQRRLGSDPNVQFMAMVRISASRFWARGSIGGRKLSSLPTTEEDFRLFDVMILGDLDASFLTQAQMRRIRRFVNDGGGLLMLGGHNSFGPGGYAGTDIEAVLPVRVGPRSQSQETTPFLPKLTAAGKMHPIFEGITDFLPLPNRDGPKEGTARLPNLLGCVSVPKARASASVLAVHPTRRNRAGPLAVLTVQRFGAGRTAAFTADTTWRWYMPMQGLGADSPYHRFWGQFVRWLAHVETKTRQAGSSVVFRLGRPYLRTDQEVRLLARVADAKGRPTRRASVSCAVLNAEGLIQQTLPLTAGRSDGLFDAVFKPGKPGAFRLRVTAKDAAGKNLGSDELPLTVAMHSAEMDRLARDDALLRRLAARSDGVYENISRLPEMIDRIVERSLVAAAPPKPRIVRLYEFTLLFLLFVALLTSEWVLRRKWQLH